MKTYTIALIVILIFAVFYIFLLDNSLSFVLTDTHTYILLGKSLSLGQGYRQIWLPGNPEYKKTPPFFPLLLAPIIYFLGYNFFVMKLICVITAIGSLGLVYLLFKRLKQSMALIILLLCGFSFQFVYYSQQILTEIPYLFFSLLALIFAKKAANRKNFYSGMLIFAIFFILISFFTRTIGASLGISMFIYLLLERRRYSTQSRFLKDIILLAFFIFIPIFLWKCCWLHL